MFTPFQGGRAAGRWPFAAASGLMAAGLAAYPAAAQTAAGAPSGVGAPAVRLGTGTDPASG